MNNKTKILNYLNSQQVSNAPEMSNDLNIPIEKVREILEELRDNGEIRIIERKEEIKGDAS